MPVSRQHGTPDRLVAPALLSNYDEPYQRTDFWESDILTKLFSVFSFKDLRMTTAPMARGPGSRGTGDKSLPMDVYRI